MVLAMSHSLFGSADVVRGCGSHVAEMGCDENKSMMKVVVSL